MEIARTICHSSLHLSCAGSAMNENRPFNLMFFVKELLIRALLQVTL